MSYSSVFLLILGLFATIKNGASIDCYDTDLGICLQSNRYADSLKECMKDKENVNKYGPCPSTSKVCIKLKVKIGSEQAVGKGCAVGKSVCSDIEKEFRNTEAKTDCDTCDSDNCNRTTLTAPISFGILIFSILVHFIF